MYNLRRVYVTERGGGEGEWERESGEGGKEGERGV